MSWQRQFVKPLLGIGDSWRGRREHEQSQRMPAFCRGGGGGGSGGKGFWVRGIFDPKTMQFFRHYNNYSCMTILHISYTIFVENRLVMVGPLSILL